MRTSVRAGGPLHYVNSRSVAANPALDCRASKIAEVERMIGRDFYKKLRLLDMRNLGIFGIALAAAIGAAAGVFILEAIVSLTIWDMPEGGAVGACVVAAWGAGRAVWKRRNGARRR